MTAFADLVGSAMLAIAFIVLSELKDENAFHQPQPHLGAHSLSVGHLLLGQTSTSTTTTMTPLLLSNTSLIAGPAATSQSSAVFDQLEPFVNSTIAAVLQPSSAINNTFV